MKIILKILGIFLLIIVLAIFITPFIFKGKIVEIAKEEINNNLNAEVNFSDFGLNMFSHFPNFTLNIDNLSVIGNDDFSNDTLASVHRISVIIDLSSVISGNTYEIKSISIDQPHLTVKILENGMANYDIALESSDNTDEPIDEEGDNPVNLRLKKFRITDGELRYTDETLGLALVARHLNHELSGDLSTDLTQLNTKTSIGSLDLDYDGIRYISNVKANYSAHIEADLKNEIYTLKKNELKLNDVFIQFNGSVSYVGDDLNLVLSFDTPKTEFKALLSMIPAVYARDFENIETSGKFSINGNIKGLYTDDKLPAFTLNMTVDQGQFKYPDLPQQVSNISLKTSITNPGGDADNTLINLSQFHMQMGTNPLDMSLKLATPVSDPNMDFRLKGKLDLGSIKNYYPLDEGDAISGEFLTDITLIGKLSSIENEKYEDFTALGSLLIKQLQYTSKSMNQPINISTAQLNFSPQYLDMVSCKMKIGNNDLKLSGKLNNAIGWAMNDELLRGELKTQSTMMNLNDLMPEDSGVVSTETSSSDTLALSVIEIPGNIDFKLESNFGQLIYDNMVMEHANGKIIVKDRTIFLNNLSMQMLGGEMKVNGTYATPQDNPPAIDFGLDISQIDIQQAYNTFAIMKEYVPIAKKTNGSFSTQMTIKSTLDEEMMPVLNTMTGGGELSATHIVIQDVNTLNKIADVMKWDEIKRMLIDKILFQFKFVDGKIEVEPFALNTNNFSGSLGGYTGFDKSIDYLMKIDIPMDKLGGSANNFLENLTQKANANGANFTLGETVPLAINIGGTLDQPAIKTGLGDKKGGLTNQVKEEVKQEIEKKKEEISKEARIKAQQIMDEADRQSKKLVEEAERQAHNIRKNASEAAIKIRNEAEKQAKSIEAEGKKKGFLAEAAAKESAKQIRQTANQKADQLEKEADEQAKAIIRKANNESVHIKKEAETEADKILKRG